MKYSLEKYRERRRQEERKGESIRARLYRVAGTKRTHWRSSKRDRGTARTCVNLVHVIILKKKKIKKERKEARGSIESVWGCNFQKLTYLTTVNMGTLHTMHILCSFYVADETFSIERSERAVDHS